MPPPSTIFTLTPLLTGIDIDICSFLSTNDEDLFACHLKSTGSLLVVCKRQYAEHKVVPWFDDPGKRVSALCWEEDRSLLVGTWEGTLFRLSVLPLFSSSLHQKAPISFSQISHLNGKIHQLLTSSLKTCKILCSCDGGRFVIINNQNNSIVEIKSPPVLVTFTSNIDKIDVFTNTSGVECALVCLASKQNVYTSLGVVGDDVVVDEVIEKKSIFKKAKDNLFSRLSSSSSSEQKKAVPSIKFTAIDEMACRGVLERSCDGDRFFIRRGEGVDMFDVDFRQVGTTFVSTKSRIFAVGRIYYFVEEGFLFVNVVQEGVFKTFAKVPFPSEKNVNVILLSVHQIFEDHHVFLCTNCGLFEVQLEQPPLLTTLNILLTQQNSAELLDPCCAALGVQKSQVCILAGDVRAEEGKFSKTIIYYKLAGLSFAQICAKFGSRRSSIAAMLFFYELSEVNSGSGGRGRVGEDGEGVVFMGELALLGRIEQYLRHGAGGRRNNQKSNQEVSLRKHILSPKYLTKRAVEYMSETSELLWALELLAVSRHCYGEVLEGLFEQREQSLFYRKRAFWTLLFSDWRAIYDSPRPVFEWIKATCSSYLTRINDGRLIDRMLRVLVPWRRELQYLWLNSGDFWNDKETAPTHQILTLFLLVLIEACKRRLPTSPTTFTYKSEALLEEKKRSSSYVYPPPSKRTTFSVGSAHVACVRNGRVWCWGEAKGGKLGLGEITTIIVDVPRLVKLDRLDVESVSVGHGHTVALTSVGTILSWGSNKYGQLGIGRRTLYSAMPVAVDLPHVIFTSVAAGSYHTVAVDHLGRAWAWGWGVFGQLGNDSVENRQRPGVIQTEETITHATAGHSHTTLLTTTGKVLVCGCNHFGQLGIGDKTKKMKVPTEMKILEPVVYVDCGICSTVLVTVKNQLYYSGLNPASLKTLLLSSKKKVSERVIFEEERDFTEPTIIHTGHIAGDMLKATIGTTHFAVLTSLGYVYTWGVGKSGQLGRSNENNDKTLELIDSSRDNGEMTIIASDVCCSGDCTFVVERESGRVLGCGFNSAGQIGKMDSTNNSTEDGQPTSIMTLRTKKRVVKIRQPSNIHFKMREVPGLPSETFSVANNVLAVHKAHVPPLNLKSNQEFLEWCLGSFWGVYDKEEVKGKCIQCQNYPAAALVEALSRNKERALKYSLKAVGGRQEESESLVVTYLQEEESQKVALLKVAISHWARYGLVNLEGVMAKGGVSEEVKELLLREGGDDSSAHWLVQNTTPLFLLTSITQSKDKATISQGDKATSQQQPSSSSS